MLCEIWPLVEELRAAGLDITVRQVQDFLQAWALLGPERENMLLAMQACWGTGEWERLVLERLVDYYFSSLSLPGMWRMAGRAVPGTGRAFRRPVLFRRCGAP